MIVCKYCRKKYAPSPDTPSHHCGDLECAIRYTHRHDGREEFEDFLMCAAEHFADLRRGLGNG